jgi:hypothetical protein
LSLRPAKPPWVLLSTYFSIVSPIFQCCSNKLALLTKRLACLDNGCVLGACSIKQLNDGRVLLHLVIN